MHTSYGDMELEIPRDRKGEFEPQLIKKYQNTVTQNMEEKIISMYAKGMTKWNSLLERISNYPVGLEFDISMIVGREEWSSYDKSTKLSLARTLNRQMVGGKLPFVKIAGKSAANVTIYIKR